MTTYKHILPLSECEAEIRRYHEKSLRDDMDHINSNRQALQLLVGAGIEPEVDFWDTKARYVKVRLGLKPKTKAERSEFAKKLVLLRQTLGRLGPLQKSEGDPKKRLVTITVNPVDFPNVSIRWQEQLPSSRSKKTKAKCKYVRRRIPASTTYDLVCEA